MMIGLNRSHTVTSPLFRRLVPSRSSGWVSCDVCADHCFDLVILNSRFFFCINSSAQAHGGLNLAAVMHADSLNRLHACSAGLVII